MQANTGKTTKPAVRVVVEVPLFLILQRKLADADYAASFISKCLAESPRTFLVGLRNLVEVRGGFAAVAKASGISREHLYRMLSLGGNPRLSSLNRLLSALGIRLSFLVDSDRRAA